MSETNYFNELAGIDVSKHVEKKGEFTYLSWPYAVSILGSFDPDATWEVHRFDGKPYLETPCGFFVEVSVTVKGCRKSQLLHITDDGLPVVSSVLRPLLPPIQRRVWDKDTKSYKVITKEYPLLTSTMVNTCIQRCLVKCIALHGLGLNVYAGEDLPMVDKSADDDEAFKQDISRQEKILGAAIDAMTECQDIEALQAVFKKSLPLITMKDLRDVLITEKDRHKDRVGLDVPQ